MAAESFKRKLTAILSADVKGYSRLMGEDEAETVKTITAYRKIMGDLIQQHRGRVIDSPGDNILAEFASVVDAVQCGVAVQNEFKARNAELPENRRMEFRIGINLGDVIEEESRIYGDGVNIAARLEALADPGGICISKTAFDQIEAKLPLGYEYLGDQTVKNIAKPVGAYKVLMEPRVTKKKGASLKAQGARRKSYVIGLVAFLALIVAIGMWQFVLRPSPPPVEKADPKKVAFPLPDKPSVAVLPFVNMSDDPKQEFFSDGMTEEIITALSKSPYLFVIARTSTFTYKGKPVKVKQVAEELGVRYVLEGSVRREGEKVRITAQFIDAVKGNHLWSERYDREAKEIFALQDEITLKVITALHVKLQAGDHVQVLRSGSKNLDAFLKAMEAREHLYRYTKEDNAVARKLYEEVITMDPNYALAYGGLAGTHINDVWLGTSKSLKESLNRAIELGQKAIALDESDAMMQAALGYFHAMARQFDKAVFHAERAVTLDPNSSAVLFNSASALVFSGKLEEAIALQQKAIRLNPFAHGQYFSLLSAAYRMVGRYDEAVKQARKAVERDPKNQFGYTNLASACILAGHEEEARAAAADLLKINPKFSLEQWARALPYKDQSQVDRMIESLRKAGLPDKPPLPLPDKPSIAVLPFVNMSDDPKQEFFSDGLSEEVINALAKLPQIFVIARNSSFTYKGRSVDVRQVGREMGVRYVLEGSVRREGNRVRITAQLVDATTGNHVFSERYDRELKDLFAMQDEITMKILTAMRVQLTEGEFARAFSKGTKNIEAYLKTLQSYEKRQLFTRESQAQARQLAEEAIALDPGYAMAYCGLANVLGNEVMMGVHKNPGEVLARAMEMAQKAVVIDDSLAQAHVTLGFASIMHQRDFDKGIAEAERAVALEPNSADIVAMLAIFLTWGGHPEEAIPIFKKAMRLSPIPQPRWLFNMANAYRMMGQYEEAISICKRIIQKQPDQLYGHIHLAAAYMDSGREEEAHAEAAEILRIDPKFSLENFAKATPRKDQAELARMVELLRKAGLK